MKVDDLLESNLLTPLNGARIVYLDGRLHETALIVAHEVITFITYYFHKLILPFVVYLEPPEYCHFPSFLFLLLYAYKILLGTE